MADKRNFSGDWRENSRGDSRLGRGGRDRGTPPDNRHGTPTRNASNVTVTPNPANNNSNSGKDSPLWGEPGPVIITNTNTGSNSSGSHTNETQSSSAMPRTPLNVPRDSTNTYHHLFPTSSTPLGNPASIIPDMGSAIAEFNSVPANAEPFRDVPSMLITSLIRPNLRDPQPDWARLLSYFQSSNARRGFANLQDFYLFITRVALPNLIIQNRRYQYSMFSARPTLSSRNRLLYQQWGMTPMAGENPDNFVIQVPRNPRIQLQANSPSTATRTILRSTPTPDGIRFTTWLGTNPAIEAGQAIPQQMAHVATELDQHLAVTEVNVRGLTFEHLMRRTIRVLRMFWWLAESNDMLNFFMLRGWDGVETYQ